MRVLLLEMPPMLRGILEHAIKVADDCEQVSASPWGGAAQEVPPDIVILGLSATEDTALVATLFARWPDTMVLTVATTGGDAALYELKPHRRLLGQVSAAEILTTLRSTIRESRLS